MVSKKLSFLERKVSNRLSYTIIASFILILTATLVYALGTVPDPGHAIAELQACDEDGEILKMVDGDWACAIDESGSGGSSQWTTSGSEIYYSGNVGIGNTNPSSKLHVTGNVKASSFSGDGSGLTNIYARATDTEATCTSANQGLLMYRGSFCVGSATRSSILNACMRTGNSTYAWTTLQEFSWADSTCNVQGCGPNEDYYQCTGVVAQPGCYTSEPVNCYCTDIGQCTQA